MMSYYYNNKIMLSKTNIFMTKVVENPQLGRKGRK